MATFDNIHSRLVYWLKILLPLAALAILSTLFLVSRRIDTDGALPYAKVDVKELASDQRLTQPQYTGVTSDGAAFSLRAGIARPIGEAGGEAEDIAATFEMQGGLVVGLGADTAQVDTAKGVVTMTGIDRVPREHLSNVVAVRPDVRSARLPCCGRGVRGTGTVRWSCTGWAAP